MDSPIGDLSDWVAVKDNIFTQADEKESLRFICGWNEDESKVAITLHEGTRKASDRNVKNRVCLLSLKDLYHIHKQLCLVNSSIKPLFPKNLKPNTSVSRKMYDYVSISFEHYLGSVTSLIGKKIMLSTFFGEEDPLSCYEENINEFRIKNMETAVQKAFTDLDETLSLRHRAETLLEITTIYALEDQVVANINDTLGEYYNFQLQPFLELREVSLNKVKQARNKLKEEIGPNIRKKAQADLEEWNDQSFAAIEALQHLYQDYYRRTLNLVLGQRDRMIQDKKKFGRASFELHAMPRLLKLELQMCQEDLKLHNAIKATREFQRDKIKSQLVYLSSDFNGVQEMERIEEEISIAQMQVLDAHLDILEIEERLYKSQLAIFNKEHKDVLEAGIFFDAVESIDDLNDVDVNEPHQNPRITKLKEKLNKIYRKRAIIRNKKKTMLSEEKRKKEIKTSIYEKNKKASIMKRPPERKTSRTLPSEKLVNERKKTLQRLREFKKKAMEIENKDLGSGSDSDSSRQPNSMFIDFSDSNQTEPQRKKVLTKKKPASDNKPHKSTNSSSTQAQGKTSVEQQPSTIPPSLDPLSISTFPSPPHSPPPPPPPPPPNIPPPPPPPPPPPSIAPPPPPPPPPSSLLSTPSKTTGSSSVASKQEMATFTITAADLTKSLKKPEIRDMKPSGGSAQSFNLDEILSIRNKLKKTTSEQPHPNSNAKKDDSMDFSAVLQATMKRIRHITEDSDLESDNDNMSDFE